MKSFNFRGCPANTLHALFLVFFAGAILSFFSCKNQVLPEPDVITVDDEDGDKIKVHLEDVEPPQNLSCTNGRKQKIFLSWSADANATRYYVYTAATPFDSFTKIAETEENRYEYTAVAGVTRYFKVSSVDYKNEESDCSRIEKGTTLACPIISDIQTAEENGVCSANVYWYMENESAYRDLVLYTVKCFLNGELVQTAVAGSAKAKEDASSQTDTSEDSDGTFYTFKGLLQNTDYQFQVEAYLVTAQDEIESSELMDEHTVATMRPSPVSEMNASKGSKKNEITLSFKLPEKSYISISNVFGSSYEEYPLYFKIYRRIVDGDGQWHLKEPHLYYDGSVSGHGIEITANMKEDAKKEAEAKILEWFDKYEAGTEVEWTDDSVARGVKYEYKIQSYVDNYAKDFTSDKSEAVNTGWAYPEPVFKKPRLEYTFNEDKTEKLAAVLTYSASWSNLGSESNYKYIVKTFYGDRTSGKTSSVIYDTLEALNSASVPFDLKKTDIFGLGDHFFTFYIVTDSTTSAEDVSSAIETLEITSKIHISADPVEPVFPGVAVQDGYKNKVIISWETEAADIIYCLYRDSSLIKEFKPGDYNFPSDTKITFTDTGLEGNASYNYVLTAQRSGGTEIFTCNDDLTAYTLGTPNIFFDINHISYDKITLLWTQVQKAEKYKLYFGDKEIETFTNSEHLNKEGDIELTVENPDYADATKSGLPIAAKVVACSSVDESFSTENVYTLGPAATATTATVAEDMGKITVTWKAVEGAMGYNIRRQRCSIDNLNFIEDADVFSVSVDGEVDSVYASALEITFDEATNTFILIDKATEKVENQPWQLNQEKIAWGLPFRYTVYPLVTDTDMLEINLDDGIMTESLGEVEYKKFNDAAVSPVGSAIGYGQNITASKSESPDKIYITWTPQFLGEIPLTPNLMLRKHGKGDYKIAETSKTERNDAKKLFIYTLDSSERTESFDFVVTYSQEANPEVDKAYVSYLDTVKDPLTKDLALKEPSNKGYAFAVKLTAGNSKVNKGIAEEFHWNLWNFKNKAIGPDSDSNYLFQMKNNDYSADWNTVCEIDLDGKMKLNNSNYNITAEANGYGLNNGYNIKPTTEGEFGYDGLLKVLRDYRHYARLVATRKLSDDSVCYKTKAVDTSGSSTITASYHDSLEDDLFAYRQITDKEFTRAVMLIVADAIYQAGISSGGDRHCDGVGVKENSNDHKFLVSHPSGSKDIVWGTYGTTYQHIFRGGTPGNANPLTSDFIIKIANCSKVGDAVNGNVLYHLPSVSIEVIHSSGLDSYKGSIEFSAGKRGSFGVPWKQPSNPWVLSITKDGTPIKSITDSNETEFKKWFPYDIGTPHDKGITSYDESAVVYSSNWW